MASAESLYADPSALLKLYIHERESAAMNKWRGRTPGALTVTHHGRAEIINGICLAAFRQQIEAPALADALASFDEDWTEGRYVQADLLWRATLNRAGELSRKYTGELGCRTLDVLHMASALELKFKQFLTFDRRQQELARRMKLRVVVPADPA